MEIAEAEDFDDRHDLDVKFQLLLESVHKILLKESSKLSYVNCYSECYALVLQSYGGSIYEQTGKIIASHFDVRVKPIVTKNLQQDRLEVLNSEWQIAYECIQRISEILMFLDNTYAVKKNLKPIFEMGLTKFRKLILHNNIITETMQNIIFGMITAEREGELIDQLTLKNVIDLLLSINSDNKFFEYEQLFEIPFLEHSKLYYQLESEKLLAKNDGWNYLYCYQMRQDEEKDRIKRYLHYTTESKILNTLESVMIQAKLEDIIHLNKGLFFMLNNSYVKELKLIFNWFKKFDTLENLQKLISQHYFALLESIIEPKHVVEKAKAIEDLLNLHLKYNQFCEDCWDKDLEFQGMLLDNFTIALNHNENSPEYLAAFVHSKIKQIDKDSSADEIEQNLLIDFMKIFKVLTDKDKFERFYKSKLAMRLMQKSINMELEKKIVQQLKLECGSLFSKNVDDMITDIITNANQLDLFKRQQTNPLEIDFSILILRQASWPAFIQFADVILPAEVENVYKMYERFYNNEKTGRKVKLYSNMGNAQIKAYYPKMLASNRKQLPERRHLFDATTLQMTIIMLFNERDYLTSDDITSFTNIPEADLVKTMQSLILSNLIKVQKEGSSEIKTYAINLEFSRKNHRLKLVRPDNKDEKKIEEENLRTKINESRGYEIEAAAVRTMKSRQILTHSNLISEIIDQLKKRFKPHIPMIEQIIKKLIDKEYFAPEPNDAKKYRYIA